MIAQSGVLRTPSSFTDADKWLLANWILDHVSPSATWPTAHPVGLRPTRASLSPSATCGLRPRGPEGATPKGEEEEIAKEIIYNIPNKTLDEVFQTAIYSVLPKHKHRVINYAVKFKWLRPLLIHALSLRLREDEFPALKGLPLPQHPPSPPRHSSNVHIKRLSRQIKSLRDDIQALTELFLEAISGGANTTPPWVCPKGTSPEATEKPVIAIVGIRRDQEQNLKRRLKDLAVLEFVNYHHRTPSQLIDFDQVYCLPYISQAWKREAIHVLGTKFVEHRGTALIVDAIERLAGVTV
jgi:hypothetical protein